MWLVVYGTRIVQKPNTHGLPHGNPSNWFGFVRCLFFSSFCLFFISALHCIAYEPYGFGGPLYNLLNNIYIMGIRTNSRAHLWNIEREKNGWFVFGPRGISDYSLNRPWLCWHSHIHLLADTHTRHNLCSIQLLHAPLKMNWNLAKAAKVAKVKSISLTFDWQS